MRLLIAASGTGGHLFPALGVAEQFETDNIQWLGVPNRLEQTLVPKSYPLHTVNVEGFQTRLSWKTVTVATGLVTSVFTVKKLLKQEKIDLVFTTGGYIAAPAILAARWQGIPVILHESNYIPGKVTRTFGRFCQTVALGFQGTAQYLADCQTKWVSTPVRSQFYTPQPLDLPIPADVPLIVVVGGSQGAIAVNQLVRESVTPWLEMGAYVVHLTGDQDPEAQNFSHPHYFALPFYDNMAGLLQRANLAISRAGAGTLTELAITRTPSILIPYPYAAEDHQTYNANVFVEAGAANKVSQKDLTSEKLKEMVLNLLNSPETLEKQSDQAETLAVADSASQIKNLINASIE
ncbi:MAG: undecaprenyldiphospho-muramoylpentapeptide beta-N-acetylglucosaminyltransferase [Microcystaceae cyanobacterium]